MNLAKAVICSDEGGFRDLKGSLSQQYEIKTTLSIVVNGVAFPGFQSKEDVLRLIGDG